MIKQILTILGTSLITLAANQLPGLAELPKESVTRQSGKVKAQISSIKVVNSNGKPRSLAINEKSMVFFDASKANIAAIEIRTVPFVANGHSLLHKYLLASNPQSQSVRQKIIGRWESNALTNNNKLLLVFTNKNLFYLVGKNELGKIINLVPGNYKINPDTFPMNLDITARHYSGEMQTLQTIFKFNSNNQLEIDFSTLPKSPRPESFSSKTILFEKVSSNGSLPQDIQNQINSAIEKQRREAPEGLRKSRNAFSIQNIALIAKAQHAFFLENGRFASQIKQLGMVLYNDRDARYSHEYKIIPQSTSKSYKIVKIIAQPKLPGLDGMVAAVVARKNRNNSYTLASVTCLTRKPSRKPLATPIFSRVTNQLECPTNAVTMNRY
ncbi:hypothetical protein NIES4071_107660 (plasmid) [Calothrix sp. NIES-4071]|nr:hypothetical protein NIES4071_107660 [Calothrix sp. NIES-4071]BAZ64806.1 hypothetical protein NIES4105_105390 [Calothrix sp. NIES-4105]